MYRKEEPEVNIEQIIARLKGIFGGSGGSSDGGGSGSTKVPYVIVGIVVLGLIGWFATGFFSVQPGEQAAVRMFGQYSDTKGTGLQWWWPGPVGARDIVSVDEIRRLELGVRAGTPVLDESLMITGDPDEQGAPGEAPNIVDVQLLVQYDIKNLEDYLYKVVSPDSFTLKDATETSLRQIVGSRPIDDVLTENKEVIQIETKSKLQGILDQYQSGIRIREVKLLYVFAPEQVKDAFDDVVRAKEDKARIINLADAYKESVLPQARGEAAKALQDAEGTRQKNIAVAVGEAESFLAIQREYNKSKDVTRKRLYLEAMEEILPGIGKILGNPDEVILVNPDTGGNIVPVPVSGGQE
ncbi:MAG: FtsH protease activity modulator HflK [Chloroflexi bacterium]|mgnify:CR=1 FL=1|nr:FtsH protease activity modulator HflK [Chloroflexota bacterium]|tara:strand:- start:1032 stop:2093 length:1062 start_codon:yes stop_codon:yes gene_type:complete